MMKTTESQIAEIKSLTSKAEEYISLKELVSEAEKQLKLLSADLKDGIKAHGSIQTAKGRLELSTVEKPSYDPLKFSEAFPNFWATVAAVDASKVRKLIDAGAIDKLKVAETISETKIEERMLIKK